MRRVVLDNEAIGVALAPHHPKHPTVMAHLEAVVAQRRRGTDMRVVVPTAVRVEAGWDRTAPTAAVVNRFRIQDTPLDTEHANVAARLRTAHAVSVADAHVGAVLAVAPADDDVVVLTSDPRDIARVAGQRRITIVTL